MEIKAHPYFTKYEFNNLGQYRKIGGTLWRTGTKTQDGYIRMTLHGVEKKTVYMHREVWGLFKGEIPADKEIDHINDVRFDNRIENLQLVTRSENIKKSVKNRNRMKTIRTTNDYTKRVRTTNIKTGEKLYFKSQCAAGKYLSCCAGMVNLLCTKRCKLLNDTVQCDYDNSDNPITEVERKQRKDKLSPEQLELNKKLSQKKYNDRKKREKKELK